MINPYLDTDAGDLFCLTFSSRFQTVYFGCQNTSLQWFDFNTLSASSKNPCLPSPSALSEGIVIRDADLRPRAKRNKFFADGLASGQATPPKPSLDDAPKPLCVLQVPSSKVIDSAHFGYVYSMALLPCPLEGNGEEENKENEEDLLVTGSGDETVKVCHFSLVVPSQYNKELYLGLEVHALWPGFIAHI